MLFDAPSLFLPLPSIFLSLWKVREERRQARNLGATNSRLAGRPADRPTDPFDHETCLLVIIARRFASPRGRVPRLVANTGCIIADASMRLARRYRINRNSREPCLFRLYALYTYIHADTNVFCRGSNFHVMRLVTRPTMHREILFLSSEVLLRRTEFRIQTHVTHNVFIRLHLSPISKLPYRTILCEIYIYSIFANRANDQLLDSRRQRSEIESESKNILLYIYIYIL